MYSYSIQDIVSTLASAKNPNAAMKHFLKREVRPGDKGARFIKELRALLPFTNLVRLRQFVEQSLPEFETHWIVLSRYAHGDALAKVVEELFNRYADAFNLTYKKGLNGVEFLNRAEFEVIVAKVLKDVPELLGQHSLASDGFMRNVVLCLTFEEEVLKHVVPLIKSEASPLVAAAV